MSILNGEEALGASRTYTKKEIRKTYKPAGTKTAAELTSSLLVAENLGNTYIVSTEGTTTDDFVDGPGHTIRIGDKYYVADIGTDSPVYKFDDFIGPDFSDYIEKSSTPGLVKNDGSIDTEIQLTVEQLSASLLLKVDKVPGKELSTNDYTDADKQIVDGVTSALADKADKDADAVEDNLASFDNGGNPVDSGISKEMLSTNTITTDAGNPVTFATKSAQIAEGFELLATAKQDLHGYDHPWPAGGGKNKLPLVLADIKAANTSGTWSSNVYSVANGTVEILVDNANNVTGIKLNGTFTSQLFFALGNAIDFEAGMKLNGWPSGVTNGALVMNNTPNYDTGNGATLTVSGNGVGLLSTDANATFSNAVVYPMLRLATESDATFAPYSNICPISGIDEVEIGVSEKNLLPCTAQTKEQHDVTWTVNADKSITVSGTPSGNSILEIGTAPVNTGMGNVRLSGLADTQNVSWNRLILFMKDGSEREISPGLSMDDQIINLSEYPNAVALFVEIKRRVNNIPCSGTARVMLELGTTASEYEPYIGTDYTINFGDTVYGVKVTEGDADENKALKVLSSSDPWVKYDNPSIPSGRHVYYIDAGLPGSKDPLSDDNNGHLVMSSNVYDINTTALNTILTYSVFSIGIGLIGVTRLATIGINTDIDNLQDFKDWVDSVGIQIMYELATPIPFPISPVTLALFAGTNVLTTDGDSIKVTYRDGVVATLADIVNEDKRVDAKLAEGLETKAEKTYLADIEGDTASKAYSVNDFMVRPDGFYKVTANIASGAAITSNNTTKVTVGSELANKVNNDDSRLSDARTPSNDNSLLHTSGNEGYISGTKYFMNGNIAMAVDQFSASNTYEVGSYTVYQGQLYKCTVRHFESDWDSSHFAISNNIIVANGTIAAGTYETIGSDYAENFETLENCPVRRFVTLDGEKIRLAQPNDYILGVTSESPSVIGDSMKQGISVGLLGKLWVEHDGSAEINGYVISGENGIAIKSDKGYRVMAVDGNKCKVLVK